MNGLVYFSSAPVTPSTFGLPLSRSRSLYTDWFVNSLIKLSSVWSFSSCASSSLALFQSKTQLKPIRTKCGKLSWSFLHPGCFLFVHCGNLKEDRQNLANHGVRYNSDVFHLAQNAGLVNAVLDIADDKFAVADTCGDLLATSFKISSKNPSRQSSLFLVHLVYNHLEVPFLRSEFNQRLWAISPELSIEGDRKCK